MKNSTLFIFLLVNFYNYLTSIHAQNMVLDQSLVVGEHTVNEVQKGTIQWNGLDFVGWNGLEWVSLTGGKTGPVTDIDGNEYLTVTIGEQVWMKENLRVTQYNNGVPIKHVTQIPIWDTLTQPAWVWSGNDAGNNSTYGKLYNGYVLLENDNICPTGWHIPDELDMQQLVEFLGGDFYAGRKLKETGLTHWEDPNDATNESGFSARGGGYRADDGLFLPLRKVGFFYHTNGSTIRFFDMRYDSHILDYDQSVPGFGYAFSIRCIKD